MSKKSEQGRGCRRRSDHVGPMGPYENFGFCSRQQGAKMEAGRPVRRPREDPGLTWREFSSGYYIGKSYQTCKCGWPRRIAEEPVNLPRSAPPGRQPILLNVSTDWELITSRENSRFADSSNGGVCIREWQKSIWWLDIWPEQPEACGNK